MLLHGKTSQINLASYLFTKGKNNSMKFSSHFSFLRNGTCATHLKQQAKCKITSGQLSSHISKHEYSNSSIHLDTGKVVAYKHILLNKTAEKSVFESFLTQRYDENLSIGKHYTPEGCAYLMSALSQYIYCIISFSGLQQIN